MSTQALNSFFFSPETMSTEDVVQVLEASDEALNHTLKIRVECSDSPGYTRTG